jgi:hypothetical protein
MTCSGEPANKTPNVPGWGSLVLVTSIATVMRSPIVSTSLPAGSGTGPVTPTRVSMVALLVLKDIILVAPKARMLSSTFMIISLLQYGVPHPAPYSTQGRGV